MNKLLGMFVGLLALTFASSAGATTVLNAGTTAITIYSNQQTTTLTAVALPWQALINGIVLTAKPSNTGTVYIGPVGVTSATGYPLVPGQSISYAVTNLSAIYIIGTNTTDVIAFTGN